MCAWGSSDIYIMCAWGSSDIYIMCAWGSSDIYIYILQSYNFIMLKIIFYKYLTIYKLNLNI